MQGRRGSMACMVDCAIRCVQLLTAGAVYPSSFNFNALSSSGRASENVTQGIGCRWKTFSCCKTRVKMQKLKRLRTEQIIGLQFSENWTIIGRQTAEKHLPESRLYNVPALRAPYTPSHCHQGRRACYAHGCQCSCTSFP